VTGLLLRRQKNLALSDEVKKMAWKAQLGRELLGFIWALAMHTEKQQNQLSQTPGRKTPALLDSNADDSAGTTERRILLIFLCGTVSELNPRV